MSNVRPYKRWTTEAVEQSFRDFNAVHGRPPVWEELGQGALPWPRTVERLYGGSFDAAMAAAGFAPRGQGRPASRSGVRVA